MKENRKWSRLLPEAASVAVTVRKDGIDEIPAQVCDESVDGLALLVRKDTAVQVGDDVEICFPDKTVAAVVRNIQTRGFMIRLGVTTDTTVPSTP